MSESTNFKSGAVRSADANHLDFTSLPLLGLIGMARTAHEGATKYGRFNYMKGMPVHDLLNHVFRHVTLFLLGDRSEPHLEHGAWGMMAAVQSNTLDPEISEPHLLGPGATLTDAVNAHLDANAPDLAAKRKAGEFNGIGNWKLTELPEVARLLDQRRVVADRRLADLANEQCKRAMTGAITGVPVPFDGRVLPYAEVVRIPAGTIATVSGHVVVCGEGPGASWSDDRSVDERPIKRLQMIQPPTDRTTFITGPASVLAVDEGVMYFLTPPVGDETTEFAFADIPTAPQMSGGDFMKD